MQYPMHCTDSTLVPYYAEVTSSCTVHVVRLHNHITGKSAATVQRGYIKGKAHAYQCKNSTIGHYVAVQENLDVLRNTSLRSAAVVVICTLPFEDHLQI